MKVYRCDYYDPTEGQCVTWHGSKREAEAELRRKQRAREDNAIGPEGVEAIDIPTTKSGLIDWLNANLHRDNG